MAKFRSKKEISDAFDLSTSSEEKRIRPWRDSKEKSKPLLKEKPEDEPASKIAQKKVSPPAILKKQRGSISQKSLNLIKKVPKVFCNASEAGGNYLESGRKMILRKSGAMFHWIKEKAPFLEEKEPVQSHAGKEKNKLPEYHLKAEGPENILIKISLPRIPGKKSESKSALLERVSERVLQALPEDDEDNIIILDLDDYFDQLKE